MPPKNDAQNLEARLNKLLAKKETYFNKIQLLYDLSKDLKNPIILEKFKIQLNTLDETLELFKQTIENINDVNVDIDPDYRLNYQPLEMIDTLYCHIKEAAKILDNHQVSQNRQTADEPAVARLKKLEVPEFNGDPKRWPMFFETFKSLVHNNSNLNNTTKMHYLAGALKGRALDVCASVVPTPENYVVFWETLVSKYQDDRLLADIYFSQMLDFKTAHQESAACLNNFLEKFDTSVNAIKHLNIPDLLDFFIASLALSKLDSQTRKLFEMSKHSEIPTYKEIIDFVKNQRKALMIDKVTDRLPTTKIPVKSLSYLRHIQLADEQFYEPSKIDGIIGASLFLHILGNSKVVGPPNLPMAVQTSLGYIVMGNVPTPTIMEVANSQTFCSIIKPSLEQILHKFWEIEEIPAPPVLNQEDAECENIFITTTTREETGRFTVALPFKEYPPVLGDSFALACKKISLSRK
ncbi:hypothetical protein NQ314_009053 [Rhamnusium bicolor]|uniref:Peptidase aspartic putative domain-containing protein n=1 Tax=Rhamnusium bicolor TaxID=1586634 RepID=A0AAV8Y3V9_9CUCU|nr:hypothetical protein NQ314_009053 [Rhamnusium bicolor]